jgi:hypothetical protein
VKNDNEGCAAKLNFARAAAAVALVAVTIAMGITAARAASLGKLEIVSGVGEPFRGRIEVVGASRHELDTLGARLSSADTYGKAGVSYAPALQQLHFRLATQRGGRHYINVTSNEPFNEPVVDLVVELGWFGGATSYVYTALVDPVGSEKSPSVSTPSAAIQTSTVAALVPKKSRKPQSDTAKAAVPGNKQTAAQDAALAEQIRMKEEKAEVAKHRLAAAQERIAELQRTVQEQQQLLASVAAGAIANDMHAAPAPRITRVSHETTTVKNLTPAPEPAGDSSETMYLAGGAAVALLALIAFMRARRRRVGDIGAEYSRLAPSFQPAT